MRNFINKFSFVVGGLSFATCAALVSYYFGSEVLAQAIVWPAPIPWMGYALVSGVQTGYGFLSAMGLLIVYQRVRY